MFVDASAIAAMLTDETEAAILAARLEGAENRMTAVPAVLDAVGAIASAGALPPDTVFALVERFLDAMAIRTVSLPAALGAPTAALMARHGRRSGGPAGLSANQCLVLAAARYYRLPLLSADPALDEAARAG